MSWLKHTQAPMYHIASTPWKWLTYHGVYVYVRPVTSDWINSVMYAHIICRHIFSFRWHCRCCRCFCTALDVTLVVRIQFCTAIALHNRCPFIKCTHTHTHASSLFSVHLFGRTFLSFVHSFVRSFECSLSHLQRRRWWRWCDGCWKHNKFHLNLASSKRMCAQRLSLPWYGNC